MTLAVERDVKQQINKSSTIVNADMSPLSKSHKPVKLCQNYFGDKRRGKVGTYP